MTHQLPPRIAPLEPPFSDEVAASLAKWMPPGFPVAPLALFRTIVHHPHLRDRMRPLGAALLGKGLLPIRVRELMLLRTCARAACAYEWGVHAAAFAGAAGLDAATIAATWSRAPVADPADALILRAADELHDTATITDDTWAALAARFDPPALLELVTVAGFYHLIAFLANAARVPLEPWARTPPA
jgi:4-carboxymuconolactone decarboxylase